MGDLFSRLCDSAQTRNEWLNTDKPIGKNAIKSPTFGLPKPFNKSIPGATEADILRGFQDRLLAQGYVICRLQNQGTIQRSGDAAFFRGSTQRGMPDCIAMKSGRFFMFEVKKPGGRATAEQIGKLLEWQTQGAYCAFVASIDRWFSENNPKLQGVQVF